MFETSYSIDLQLTTILILKKCIHFGSMRLKIGTYFVTKKQDEIYIYISKVHD